MEIRATVIEVGHAPQHDGLACVVLRLPCPDATGEKPCEEHTYTITIPCTQDESREWARILY